MADKSSDNNKKKEKAVLEALRRDQRDLEKNPSIVYLAEKRLTEVAKEQAKEAYPSPPAIETKDRRRINRKRKQYRDGVVNKYLTMSHSEGEIFGVPEEVFKSWPPNLQVQRVKDWNAEQATREEAEHRRQAEAAAQQQTQEIMLRLDQSHQRSLQVHQQHLMGSFMAILQMRGAAIPHNLLQQFLTEASIPTQGYMSPFSTGVGMLPHGGSVGVGVEMTSHDSGTADRERDVGRGTKEGVVGIGESDRVETPTGCTCINDHDDDHDDDEISLDRAGIGGSDPVGPAAARERSASFDHGSLRNQAIFQQPSESDAGGAGAVGTGVDVSAVRGVEPAAGAGTAPVSLWESCPGLIHQNIMNEVPVAFQNVLRKISPSEESLETTPPASLMSDGST